MILLYQITHQLLRIQFPTFFTLSSYTSTRGLSRNIWSGYISGPAGPIMSNINGPPRPLYTSSHFLILLILILCTVQHFKHILHLLYKLCAESLLEISVFYVMAFLYFDTLVHCDSCVHIAFVHNKNIKDEHVPGSILGIDNHLTLADLVYMPNSCDY